MSQKSASVTAEQTIKQTALAFETIPPPSPIFLDFLKDAPALKDFYPEKNTPLDQFAARVINAYKTDRTALAEALIEVNQSLGAGEKTFENIELLRAKDCVAIVAGQQAGIFTGALYTIYKAFSAIKLADELRRKNIKAVPVFWIAEEDHDFDEVQKTFNLDQDGNLFAAENTPSDYQENTPVGLVNLDETITETIKGLIKNLPHTQFTDEVEKLLIETYRTGESYSQAFGRLIARIFNDYGLIIVSPLNNQLKKLCAPIFAEAVEKSAEIISALLEKNRELENLNYQPQVLVTEDNYPFFYQNENGARQPLRRSAQSGKIAVRHTKIEFDTAELSETARRFPYRLSPNALMRPVVQDYLLPTLVYFGGGAEIAYFAQSSAIYKILQRPATPIRHRASFTVIERKHQRTLDKYALKFTDLFAGREKIQSIVVEKYLNQNLAAAFSEIEENFNLELDRLDGGLRLAEPTLSNNLAHRRKKILWHIAALRKKYHRAEINNNEVVNRRIDNLFAALLPHGALQERTLNVTTFLNFYGVHFIEWLDEAIDADAAEHQILYL